MSSGFICSASVGDVMKASLATLDSYMVSYVDVSREYCICGCELQLQENLFPAIIAGVTPIITQVKIWSTRESCRTVRDLYVYLLQTIRSESVV